MSFIDEHRNAHGVESICEQWPIVPSTYSEYKARERDPGRKPVREQRDVVLEPEVCRVWSENLRVYGARKVWLQLNRESVRVARCTVARLIRKPGKRGVCRGSRWRTTIPDEAQARPADLVQRAFSATRPDELWVADITFVSTWRGPVYVAFVIDVFSRRIVGWRVRSSLRTDFVDSVRRTPGRSRSRPSRSEALATPTTTPWPKR